MTDRAGDGTPDFLRLDDPADRRTFVRWFTFLAEQQYFRQQPELPREVSDCAGLVRFAYREALREHTGTWASELRLDGVPAEGSLTKYRYPFTPMGANLFRVTPGPFAPGDLERGRFAQFADALHLMRWNTHRTARDAATAEPGDLLFFQQLEQDLPFHVMVYLGPSQFQPDPAPRLVYHTGPLGGGPGEVRRPTVEELLRHPAPRWRPKPGNGNFLGVFRWNILRD